MTEAVICRNIDWISAWISVSVFSAGGVSSEGVEFSLSVDLEEDFFLEGLENIWTCGEDMSEIGEGRWKRGGDIHRIAIVLRVRPYLCLLLPPPVLRSCPRPSIYRAATLFS